VTRVLVVLLRLVVMLCGYVAACLAASAFLHLLFLGPQDFSAAEAPSVGMGSVVVSIPFVALFVANFAFLPSIAVLAIAELLRRRDWLTYALGGAAVGLAVVAMFWQAGPPIADGLSIDDGSAAIDAAAFEPKFFGLLIGAGIVGGLAYWLAAGRRAGSAMRSRREIDPRS
jgi:hypothetical protein